MAASYDQLSGVVFSGTFISLSNTVAVPTIDLVWIAATIIVAFLVLYFVMRSGRRGAEDPATRGTTNSHSDAGPNGAEARARAEELRIILDAVPGMVLIANDPLVQGDCRKPYGLRITSSAIWN